MKTQVSILVRKESLYSQLRWKLLSFTWFINIFRKSSGVDVWIDKGSENQKYQEFEPRKEPYIIDLEPGYHEILFEDQNVDRKQRAGFFFRLIGGMAVGSFVSGAGGEGLSTFSKIVNSSGSPMVKDGVAAFTLHQGETIQISCRPAKKGNVKVKLMN